jgi:hypothetical protein
MEIAAVNRDMFMEHLQQGMCGDETAYGSMHIGFNMIVWQVGGGYGCEQVPYGCMYPQRAWVQGMFDLLFMGVDGGRLRWVPCSFLWVRIRMKPAFLLLCPPCPPPQAPLSPCRALMGPVRMMVQACA